MTKFLIETNEVETVADSIKEIYKSAKDVVKNIDGYDVECSEFDFAGAKDAILTNAKGTFGKFKLTSSLLTNVVKVHNELQDSVKPKAASDTNNAYSSSRYAQGSYSSSSYSSSSPSASITSPTSTVEPTPVTYFGEVANGQPIREVADIAALISAGTIPVIKEDEIEEKTKETLSLVVRICKDDPDFDEKMQIINAMASKYGLALAVVYIDKKDESSLSLIKNNNEITSTKSLTEEDITKMLDGAPDEIKEEYDMENDFIYYNQGEYGAYAYAGETIAAAGCGPTSTAMVLTYLTGETIDPVAAASWSEANGYACDGNGTYEGLFAAMATEYNLNSQVESQTAANIKASLEAGHMIIAHMGPGEFTSGGHYIVLRGLDENGNVLVADPASIERTTKAYPLEIFEQEAKGSMTSIWS